jgi:hypothetical protein
MATLSHTLPAGPTVVAPAEGSTLPANAPVVINWNPVTQPYPGTTSPITISGYQVIVERDRRKSPVAFNVTLPPTVTRVTVPPEFIQAKREYKFEVLAIDKSGNQTITEGASRPARSRQVFSGFLEPYAPYRRAQWPHRFSLERAVRGPIRHHALRRRRRLVITSNLISGEAR